MTTYEINGNDNVYKSNLISNCCEEYLYDDSDICPRCKEHCEAVDPDIEETNQTKESE